MDSQVLSGAGRGVYNPFFLMVGLEIVQEVHDMILVDILLEFWPIKILLQYYHGLLNAKVAYHLTMDGFPNHLCTLT